MSASRFRPLGVNLLGVSLNDVKWFLLLLITLSITISIQYLSKYEYIPIHGIYVPDGVAYELRAFNEINNLSLSANSYTFFNQIIYTRLGSIGFFISNASLLFVSIFLCKKVFQNISRESVSFARFAIVFNPYLLIGAIGPNKEIILIFTNLLFWYLFSFKIARVTKIGKSAKSSEFLLNFLLFCTASIPLFIRPIVSISLYGAFVFKVLGVKKFKLYILIIVLSILLSINFFPDLSNLYFSLQNEALGSFESSAVFDFYFQLNEYAENPILFIPVVLARILIILFSPLFRRFDYYNFLDMGYSFLAFVSLPINIALCILILKSNKYLGKISSIRGISNSHHKYCVNQNYTNQIFLFVSFSILLMTLNSLPVPRYLFPFYPFTFALFPIHNRSTKKAILIFSIIISFIVILIRFEWIEYQDSRLWLPSFMDWL